MEVTILRNGPTLPTPAIDIALELESRGLRLEVTGAVLRVVSPDGAAPVLSEDEKTTIRRYKAHLMALVEYCELATGVGYDEWVGKAVQP